jgi:hypothetical protein
LPYITMRPFTDEEFKIAPTRCLDKWRCLGSYLPW